MSFDSITGAWDYAKLPPNVRIGAGCFLERKDSFERFRSVNNLGLVLGNRAQVYTWSAFSVEPTGTVSVGDDTILVGAIFMCAESISIGNRVVISYNVTIADSDFHPRDPDVRRPAQRELIGCNFSCEIGIRPDGDALHLKWIGDG